MKRVVLSSTTWLVLLLCCSFISRAGHAATVQVEATPPVAAGIQLAVALQGEAMADLYGIALDLVYDPEYLAVVDADPTTDGVQPKVEEGTILNENGATLTLLRAALEDGKQGRLVVGLTRSKTATGVDVADVAALFTVFFKPLKPGNTAIVFARQGLFDSQNNPITPDSWPELALDIVATLTIHVTNTEHGHVEPEGEVAVLDGGDQTFVIVPDQGFVVADLRIDNQSAGPLTTYTFSQVTVDHTLHAIFRRLPGDLDGDGSVTLADGILAASLLARLPTSLTIHLDAEVNQDNRIGPEELVYILQDLAEKR